jgi:hypothetical protein
MYQHHIDYHIHPIETDEILVSFVYILGCIDIIDTMQGVQPK